VVAGGNLQDGVIVQGLNQPIGEGEMKSFLMGVAVVLGLGHAVAPASPVVASLPSAACADLSLGFFPSTVDPGQGMDYEFDLLNCGSIKERLTVRLQPQGPCPFLPPSRKTYVLEPGHGLQISALMIAPSCPGDYSLRGMVRFGERRLDKAVASFTVLDTGIQR
jgi:hypothetical protein